MKTNQLMKRNFNGNAISQRTEDRFFNATELLAIYNANSETKKRFDDFWRLQGTQEFLRELENELLLNHEEMRGLKTYETTRGRYGGATWMHPYLFVEFAMWLSPKFKIQIIKWVYDNLIDFRHQAGDYYNELRSALYEWYIKHGFERKDVNSRIYVDEANYLNLLVFGNMIPKQRNTASEYELALMNDLQLYDIILLEDNLGTRERKAKLLERKNNFERMNKRIKK